MRRACVCVCVCARLIAVAAAAAAVSNISNLSNVSNISNVECLLYTRVFTVYEPPLLLISIRTSAYTNLRVYEPPLHQWKGISCKQNARWQHISTLKASAFFSLKKKMSC